MDICHVNYVCMYVRTYNSVSICVVCAFMCVYVCVCVHRTWSVRVCVCK